MPVVEQNTWRGVGLLPDAPLPGADPSTVSRLLQICPRHGQTPLHRSAELAELSRVRTVWIKDERQRMALGSFKALGAAFAIACDAENAPGEGCATALAGRTYVTASAGNHGLSVAAGARVFGARAVVYIADTVAQAFADRLAALGATVVRQGRDYEASMEAAARAASARGWSLLSDSSWEGYTAPALRVMEGYLQLAQEVAGQIAAPPSHILLQAGVGGMAAAVAAHARKTWGDAPRVIVVEPAFAPALVESIRAGALVTASGPVSGMGRLDCKTPSLVALAGLSRDADQFATITEAEAEAGVSVLARLGFATTPSGGAGIAALLAGLDLGPEAQVLTILSEGPQDAE
ncbi:MAG: pyridoxal-phosphate dependent enzyme [Pseudomonadota bacterium]